MLHTNDQDNRLCTLKLKNSARAQGVKGLRLANSALSVSVHMNYSDYHHHMQELREYWGANIERVDSFIVGLLNDNMLRELSFKYLRARERY